MKSFRICLVIIFLCAIIMPGETVFADGIKTFELTIIHRAMEDPPDEGAYELSFKLYKDNIDWDEVEIIDDAWDWYDSLDAPMLELIDEFTFSKSNMQTTVEGLDPGSYLLALIPPPGYDLMDLEFEPKINNAKKARSEDLDLSLMEIIPFELYGDAAITVYTGIAEYNQDVDVKKSIVSVNGAPVTAELPELVVGDEIVYDIEVTNISDSGIKIPYIVDLYSNGLDFPGGDPVNALWQTESVPPIDILYYDGLANDLIPSGESRIVKLKLIVIGLPLEGELINVAFVPYVDDELENYAEYYNSRTNKPYGAYSGPQMLQFLESTPSNARNYGRAAIPFYPKSIPSSAFSSQSIWGVFKYLIGRW